MGDRDPNWELGLSAIAASSSPERLATFLALTGSPVAW